MAAYRKNRIFLWNFFLLFFWIRITMSTSKWLLLIFTTHLYKKTNLYFKLASLHNKTWLLNNCIFKVWHWTIEFFLTVISFLSFDLKQRNYVVLRINERQIAHFLIRYNNGLKDDKNWTDSQAVASRDKRRKAVLEVL